MIVFNPGSYQRAAAQMSTGLVLGLAVLLEVAIAMVLLSQVLGYRANRWANIIAGIESTAFVAVTMLGGIPPAYYLFFATIEMACTLFIVCYAWTWRNPQD